MASIEDKMRKSCLNGLVTKIPKCTPSKRQCKDKMKEKGR